MTNDSNLSELMEERLPPEAREVLKTASLAAAEQGYGLYLVGGVVRDLLLGRENLDLDLVVEGDAIALAYRLAEIVQGKVTAHNRFRTATVRWDGRSVDLATARSETYSRPGALPAVKLGDIETDLSRRDFTINSMAVDLSAGKRGRLIDPHNGREDLKKRLVRVLHENSFVDDATRIWRAVRYEQRLDFEIEPETLKLLKRHIDMLDTVSRDRIRHELELVLAEERPEKVLRRAAGLGVLDKLYPGLKGDDWLAEKFRKARETVRPEKPPVELYLAILAYRLNGEQTEKLISGLGLRKRQSQALGDVLTLKSRVKDLADPDTTPGSVYTLLHGLSPTALTAVLIAGESQRVEDNISLYLDKLCRVRTALTGSDLRRMGISPGPRMREVLDRLLLARLNGEVADRQGEVEMVGRLAD
jgi:tRNA nucleotidyltransferase (CCA-adding enzyme)